MAHPSPLLPWPEWSQEDRAQWPRLRVQARQEAQRLRHAEQDAALATLVHHLLRFNRAIRGHVQACLKTLPWSF
jgi:hypothetical protein